LKKAIHPEGMSKPFGVWTTAFAVDASRLLFISGLTARGPDGKVVGVGSMAEQTRQVCENLRKSVAAAGVSLSDIVWVQVFTTDVSKFAEIHAVRRQYFPSEPPASTMVEVPRLVDKDCLIEINAIAALPMPSGGVT
jgi:2-iminobutanoate/2-iminopropanoate deaminase